MLWMQYSSKKGYKLWRQRMIMLIQMNTKAFAADGHLQERMTGLIILYFFGYWMLITINNNIRTRWGRRG
ncbi:hypothetical protein KY284_033313 [Solanum tuberosum]|nr:hypothetical protein KY284_033313 [Solanum tuberosum]